MSIVEEPKRGDPIARGASILVSAAVVFLAGWMTLEANDPRPIKKDADAGLPAPAVSTSGRVEDASTPTSEAQDAGISLQTLSLGDAGLLPTSAPKSIHLGVVLVTFAGAEGASAGARKKPDALALATRLAEDAKTDFHRAVGGGDSGSSDDIGRLPRGTFADPRTEAAVFSLEPGQVSDVVETARGYWIVKRLD